MASGNKDLDCLASRANSIATAFDNMYVYFKANTGATVQQDEELFSAAAQEARAFSAALGSARIRALFMGTSKPSSVSKPAFFGNRAKHNASKYSTGKSTKLSGPVRPSKPITIGFADDDNGSTGTDVVVTPATPSVTETPPPDKAHDMSPTASVKGPPINAPSVTQRIGSRPISIGFADDSDSDSSTNTIYRASGAVNNAVIGVQGDKLSEFSEGTDWV
ncbi:hypothetical protein F5Y08DRAFT_344066 [Xylaria arbuscula]|nr:hypothetical protein F5Y08DRAFT_344066 [Xylaria arbuscula]